MSTDRPAAPRRTPWRRPAPFPPPFRRRPNRPALPARFAWAGLIAALGLSLLVRLPFLAVPIISDEGGYAHVARRWLDGDGRLYHDLWISRPQGIFVAYALILETLGGGVAALRLGAWLFAAATLLLVWGFARSWRGPGLAAVAALLFALLAASPAIEGFTANSEVFMALPAAAVPLLLLRAARRGWGAGPLLAAGAAAALAALLKPAGVVMLGVGLAFAWLLAPDGRMALRRGGWVLAGFAAALAPALVHGWWLGWDAFLFAALTYRLSSQSGATAGLGHQLEQLSALLTRCAPALALLAVALAAHYGHSPRLDALRGGWKRMVADAGRLGVVDRGVARFGRAFDPARVDPGTLLLRLWLLASLAGVAVGGDWWAHYLIQPAAPFALWLAHLLAGAWPRLGPLRRQALVAAAVAALLAPYAVVARGTPEAIGRAVFHQQQYEFQDEVAAYLREHVPPGEPIFVAFDHPAIYYLADRPAAYRYLYDQELQAIPASYGQLLDLINGPNRPRYIVAAKEQDAPYPDRGRAFWDAVVRRYHHVETVRGIPIMREDDGLGRGR